MVEIGITHSLDARELERLSQRWSTARTSPDAATLRALEQGFEAHRSKLFLENAALQAERPEDAEASARIESNQLAIKVSTIALGELREALTRR
jgi:hypothetical protein